MEVRDIQIYFPEYWEDTLTDELRNKLMENAKTGKYDGFIAYRSFSFLYEINLDEKWIKGFKAAGGELEETCFKEETEELMKGTHEEFHTLHEKYVRGRKKDERVLQNRLWIKKEKRFEFYDYSTKKPFEILQKLKFIDDFFLSGKYIKIKELAEDIYCKDNTTPYVIGNSVKECVEKARKIYDLIPEIREMETHF